VEMAAFRWRGPFAGCVTPPEYDFVPTRHKRLPARVTIRCTDWRPVYGCNGLAELHSPTSTVLHGRELPVWFRSSSVTKIGGDFVP
jgi:hypothetical protein